MNYKPFWDVGPLTLKFLPAGKIPREKTTNEMFVEDKKAATAAWMGTHSHSGYTYSITNGTGVTCTGSTNNGTRVIKTSIGSRGNSSDIYPDFTMVNKCTHSSPLFVFVSMSSGRVKRILTFIRNLNIIIFSKKLTKKSQIHREPSPIHVVTLADRAKLQWQAQTRG